jgi:ATP-dependent protease ClpP protease subunit
LAKIQQQMNKWSKIFKNKKPAPGDYLRVITSEENNKAEMFLYGYIGQDFWWADDETREETLTDLAFVKEFRKLEAKYDEIHIRINSPGGSVFHGDAIISAIQNSEAAIHTYNDGMAASMGFDIWVAGNVRHMAENAKAMCHCTMSFAMGNTNDMLDAAEMLEKFDEAAISILAKETGLPAEEIKTRFYDGKDHWMIAKDLQELGLIDKPEGEAEDVEPDAEKMKPVELIQKFHQHVVLHKWDESSKEQFAILEKAINKTAAPQPEQPQKTKLEKPRLFEMRKTLINKLNEQAEACS